MVIDIEYFAILDAGGIPISTKYFSTSPKINIHSDKVLQTALSRVSNNLLHKSMSINYYGIDNYITRKGDKIIVLGTNVNISMKPYLKKYLNHIFSEERFSEILQESDIKLENIENHSIELFHAIMREFKALVSLELGEPISINFDLLNSLGSA